MAISAHFELGRIVWAEVADPNGHRKLRPGVIVTPTAAIQPDGPLTLVAVTSRLPDPLPADHVLLPWHPQRHPRTRLNRKSAAVCSWLCSIHASDIQEVAGSVPGECLLRILALIHAMHGSSPGTN